MSRPNLFRVGNTTSPKFDNVRVGTDIKLLPNGLVDHTSGGMSTFSEIQTGWDLKRTWILKASKPLGSMLIARNDLGVHWLIAPKEDIELKTYTAELTKLNALAEKYSKSLADVKAAGLVLPKQSAHNDKATRFVFNALSSVVHDHIPVPGIPDWDENDISYLAILAKAFDDGSLQLSDLTWDPEGGVNKQKAFVAAAVSGYMKWEESVKVAQGNEDEQADLANDHALLCEALKLNDTRNPLAKNSV